MINLSADSINARTPYKVERIDETSFVFTTNGGVVYSVGFVRDTSFMDYGLYQFFISNIEHKHSPEDRFVYETIRVVIEEFFAQGQPVMLYICDSMDDRQAARDRLFKFWFNTYLSNVNFTMYNENILIDNVCYYTSIILRKDHPMHNQVISSFHDFVQDIPNKLNNM